jgi:hypothetical protein
MPKPAGMSLWVKTFEAEPSVCVIATDAQAKAPAPSLNATLCVPPGKATLVATSWLAGIGMVVEVAAAAG